MRKAFLLLVLLASSGAWAQTFPTVANLAVRYESDCITFTSSVCSTPSNNSTLTTWADESGNANTATVGSGTCTFHTNQVNGKPSVSFSSCLLNLASGVHTISLGQTTFVVLALSNASGSGYQAIWSGDQGANHNSYTYMFGGGASQNVCGTGLNQPCEQVLMQVAWLFLGHSSTVADTAYHQMNVAVTSGCGGGGGLPGFRQDSAAVTGGNSYCSGATDIVQTAIGNRVSQSDMFFSGSLAALISYSRQLSSTEIGQVETYLYCKYNLGSGTCAAPNVPRHHGSIF